MANEEHLELLKQGVEAWNKWRSRNANIAPDLSEADLSEFASDTGFRAKFSKANFREANLNHANFGDANLDGADLAAARLKGAKFCGCHIEKADFSEAYLDGADFSKARLKGTNFHRAILEKAKLCKAFLYKANFSNAYLANASLTDADLTEANFRSTDLKGADLSETNLRDANLSHSSLDDANLSRAAMYGANLRSADLSSAELMNTDLRHATLNSKTVLIGASVEQCRIYRFQLEFLQDYGGLAKGNLAEMLIEDDIGDLRASFRGINLWIHLFALVAFLFPYLFFAGIRYSEARFLIDTDANTIPLWEAIARYIWNGGQSWQDGWHFHWSFLAFVALTFYNLCRWLLLSKTSELEHRQQIIGLPVNFRSEERYLIFLLRISMSWMSWISLMILAINTGHFLTQEVPISLH